jgi:hypothetical protein
VSRATLVRRRSNGELTVVKSASADVFRAATLLVFLLSGCRDQSMPTENYEPPRSRAIPTPTFSQAPPTIVTLPPAAQFNTVASTSIPAFTTPTLVHITASGNVTVLKNWPLAEQGTPFATIPPPGGNQGLQTMNCYGQVTVWFQQTGTRYLGPCNGPAYTEAVLVHGIGSAQRGQPYPGATPAECGFYPYTPCYSFTGGSQTITITPVAVDLRLTSSATAVSPGALVTFLASVTPDSVDHIAVPLSIQAWRWVPDSVSNGPSCSLTKVCSFSPSASGTMFVDAVVNGTLQTKSVYVQVIACPQPDSLLNDRATRDALLAAWNGSNPTAEPATQRVERDARLDCIGGVCQWILEPVGSGDNWCHSTIESNENTKATIHTHPFKEGSPLDPLPWPLPANCNGGESPSGNPDGPGATLSPGLSKPDWDNLNPNIPNYVVNGDQVYRYGGGVGAPFFPRSTRAGASCDPLVS